MKKAIMFLYLAVVLAACDKDKGGNFPKSAILTVEVKYLQHFVNQGTRAFVFLTNHDGEIIGSVEVDNYQTYEIINEIPYNGGGFDVNIATVSYDASNSQPTFYVETFTDVLAEKIYVGGNSPGNYDLVGTANIHVEKGDNDWYQILSDKDFVHCDTLPSWHCEPDISIGMGAQASPIFAQFFKKETKEWRYGLLPSVQIGENITINAADLPHTAPTTHLDIPAIPNWCYFLTGFNLDGPNPPIGINLSSCLVHQKAPEAYDLLVPTAAFSRFWSHFDLSDYDSDVDYDYQHYGSEPIISYHPTPLDFVVTENGQIATLTTPGGSDIKYYRLDWKKRLGTGAEFYWHVNTDMSQTYKIPNLPDALEDLMPNELKNMPFKLDEVGSVRDSKLSDYQQFMQESILMESPPPFDYTQDSWREFKSKQY